jgi:tetratricopeptide (TPR) repeat protein
MSEELDQPLGAPASPRSGAAAQPGWEHYLAYRAHVEAGETGAAAAAIRRAIAAGPCALYYNELGAMQRTAGLGADAAESLRRAVLLDAGYSRAYANLGCVLAESGRKGAARAAVLTALDMGPDNPGARAALLSWEAEAAGSLRSYLRDVFSDCLGFVYQPPRKAFALSLWAIFFTVAIIGCGIIPVAARAQVEHAVLRRALGLDADTYAELVFARVLERRADDARASLGLQLDTRFAAALDAARRAPELAPVFARARASIPEPPGASPFDVYMSGALDPTLAYARLLALQVVDSHSASWHDKYGWRPNPWIATNLIALVLAIVVPLFCWARFATLAAIGTVARIVAPRRLPRLVAASGRERLHARIVLASFFVLPALEIALTWATMGIEPPGAIPAILAVVAPDAHGQGLALMGGLALATASVGAAYQVLATGVGSVLALLGIDRGPLPFAIVNAVSAATLALLGAAPLAIAIAASMAVAATVTRGLLARPWSRKATLLTYAGLAGAIVAMAVIGPLARAPLDLPTSASPTERSVREQMMRNLDRLNKQN